MWNSGTSRARDRDTRTGIQFWIDDLSKRTAEKKPRTSWNGWRIVAGGVLLLIFGFSFVTNDFGPIWFGGAMLVAGIGLVLYGRRH